MNLITFFSSIFFNSIKEIRKDNFTCLTISSTSCISFWYHRSIEIKNIPICYLSHTKFHTHTQNFIVKDFKIKWMKKIKCTKHASSSFSIFAFQSGSRGLIIEVNWGRPNCLYQMHKINRVAWLFLLTRCTRKKQKLKAENINQLVAH